MALRKKFTLRGNYNIYKKTENKMVHTKWFINGYFDLSY